MRSGTWVYLVVLALLAVRFLNFRRRRESMRNVSERLHEPPASRKSEAARIASSGKPYPGT